MEVLMSPFSPEFLPTIGNERGQYHFQSGSHPCEGHLKWFVVDEFVPGHFCFLWVTFMIGFQMPHF